MFAADLCPGTIKSAESLRGGCYEDNQQQDAVMFLQSSEPPPPPSISNPALSLDKTGIGGKEGRRGKVVGEEWGDKNPSEGVYLLSTPPKRSIFLIWVRVIIFHITALGSRVKWLIF